MIEHIVIVAHCIPLSNNVLIEKSMYRDQLIMKETELHPNNVSMQPITHSVRKGGKHLLFRHKLVVTSA
jgi:hypothetical protein